MRRYEFLSRSWCRMFTRELAREVDVRLPGIPVVQVNVTVTEVPRQGKVHLRIGCHDGRVRLGRGRFIFKDGRVTAPFSLVRGLLLEGDVAAVVVAIHSGEISLEGYQDSIAVLGSRELTDVGEATRSRVALRTAALG